MSETALKPGESLTVMPKGGWLVPARIWHLAVALIGTASFIISCTLAMTNEGNGGALNGLFFTLSYFTVWSNILVAITNWMLFANPARDGRVFRWYRMTTLVMIVITGLIYDLVLAASAHPTGWGAWSNLGYHYIVPWATLAGFLIFGPRPRFTLRHVFEMLIIPVIWLAYTLIRGLFLLQPPANPPTTTTLGEPQHWYPYPFINVNDPTPLIPGLKAPGYQGVAYNLVVIIILGIAFGFLFLGLDRWFSGGRKPTPLVDGVPESTESTEALERAEAQVAASDSAPAESATVLASAPTEPPHPDSTGDAGKGTPPEAEHWSAAQAERASSEGAPADQSGEAPKDNS